MEVASGTPRAEPIFMPSRAPTTRARAQQWGHAVGCGARMTRAEAQRLGELLRAARTPEGRRHYIAPLASLAFTSALLVGLGWGWSHSGHH